MREMSVNIRGTNLATGLSPFESCRIADIGDAPVNGFDHEASVDMMTEFCRAIADAGAWPLAAGGDHLITFPILRGTSRPTDKAMDWSREQGITLVDADMFFDMGAKAVAELARDVVGSGPVHVTIDIDGVDPSDMPGTGSPEPGGPRMRDMQVMLRGLRGLDVISGDVNEVSPPYDRTGYAALNAAHLMFEVLCLLGENRARS